MASGMGADGMQIPMKSDTVKMRIKCPICVNRKLEEMDHDHASPGFDISFKCLKCGCNFKVYNVQRDSYDYYIRCYKGVVLNE